MIFTLYYYTKDLYGSYLFTRNFMSLLHKLPLHEPQLGKDVLVQFNKRFVSQDILVSIAPVLADGVVLTFPVLLVVRYLWWVKHANDTYKYWAFYVMTSAAVVSLVALFIQEVVEKSRPEGYIGNADLLIMDHLPTAPFPSDHASVWFAVAMATILRAKKNDIKTLLYIGYALFVWAIIMSFARVGVGIHRPTDVIAWCVLWCLIAFVLQKKTLWDLLVNRVYKPLVSLQKWIFGRLFGIHS